MNSSHNPLCILGIHSWNSCICVNCGKKRDHDHVRVGCVCSRCGMELHDWQYDYYCGYANEHSDTSFGCGTCGSAWSCGGEIVEKTCAVCGKRLVES